MNRSLIKQATYIISALVLMAGLSACEDYGELKPVLDDHIAVLMQTSTSIHASKTAESLCASLSSFNHRMESIISGYESLRKKNGGPVRLFSSPPSPLMDKIDQIRILTGTLRDSLLSIHTHTDNAAVRRALIETVDTLDKIRD